MKLIRCLGAVCFSIATIAVASCAETASSNKADALEKEKVVLLHGFGRDKSAMWLLASRIEEGGFDVVQIGYDSLGAPPEEITRSVAEQIETCCGDSQSQVHFVGHSLGGLIIRAYLAEERRVNRGRVVLIATPNSGTPLVDDYRDTWLMDLAGPTARALGTDPESFPNSLPAPDYPVGVIAGVRQAGIEEDDRMPGVDDGVVPVESAKLEGMTDFVIVRSSHSLMRYSRSVAKQTLTFLRSGTFDRRP